MGITSLDIKNSLSTNRAKIINILDFDSKKLSILRTKKKKIHVYYDHNPFFLSIDNLKGYFEHYDDKNNIVGRVKDKNNIVGTAKHDQYTRIKFKTNNDLPTNILINIRNLDIKEFI